MIAAANSRFAPASDRRHRAFLALVPRIELHARIYFRHLRCRHKREDAVAETLALAWKWFLSLDRRGKDAARFVTTFASLAALAVRSGRRLCGQLRAKDVLSAAAQRRHGFRVERLPSSTRTAQENLYAVPHGQERHDAYEERLRDNTVTPVPDQVQFRIDFPAWLSTLTGRERRLIRAMALNERTLDLSRRFGVSPARISQLRREFARGWQRFCDGPPLDVEDPAGVA
jgi:hypothetical protein